MKVGDLVKFYDYQNKSEDDTKTGLVLEIISWVDKGAPNRNFGIDVKVLWSNGSQMLYALDELELVSEGR